MTDTPEGTVQPADGARPSGLLVLEVGRATWCPLDGGDRRDLTLGEVLERLRLALAASPLVEAPVPDSLPEWWDEAGGAMVRPGLPVATRLVEGAALAHLAQDDAWCRLGPDHVRVLLALSGPVWSEHLEVDDVVSDAVPALLAGLAAVGAVSLSPPTIEASDVAEAAPAGDGEAAAGPEGARTLVRLPRAWRLRHGAAQEEAPTPSPIATEPVGAGDRIPVFSFWATADGPPVGVASVLAYARVHEGGRLLDRYQLRRIDRPVEVVRHLRAHEGPAILLCGNYDWSIAANREVAAEALAVHPDLVVVHGGPSTPRHPIDCEPFLRGFPGRHVAVVGEGELTFVELLDRLAVDGPDGPTLDVGRLSDVAGVRYVDEGGAFVATDERPRHANLEDFPSALTTGELELVPDRELNIIPIETNRGCPYSCTFCDWGAATMSRIRRFPIERVEAELAWLAAHRVTTWYVADANFGIFPRDLEIAAEIARYREATGYPEILVAFPAKNATERYLEIIDTFVGSGVTLKAALALQSRDPVTLATVKRHNIKTESYDRLAAESRRRGLPVLTELMVGLPGSTVASMKDDLQWGIDRHVRAFLYPTVVLPNAPMNHPDERARLAIRTVDGRIVATSSFTRDQREEMDRLAAGYHTLEVLGVLRHVLRYLQWDHGRRAIDVIHQVVEEVHRDPEATPLLTFLLRHGDHFLIPPGGWQPVLDEARALLVGRLGVTDDPGLATAIKVSAHLLPRPGRSFPDVLAVDHDYVAYFRSTLPSLHATGEPGVPAHPLVAHGPGFVEVRSSPRDLLELFGRWEEADPFQQAQDFESASPLVVYHSSESAPAPDPVEPVVASIVG